MYILRTHDRYGNEITHPENAPIINIQCNDPIIDLLGNYVDPDDTTSTLADLINLLKMDLENELTKERFLVSDLKKFFDAIGMI